MRFVIQRVTHAGVTVDNKITGEIDNGFLVFIGIGKNDTKAHADKLIKKMAGLRIFDDENGKTNLALNDVGGSLLLVSQFTLYADCRKGFRPSFTNASAPDIANDIYEYIINECKSLNFNVQTGIFGAEMKVSINNDGPFTIILETDEAGNII